MIMTTKPRKATAAAASDDELEDAAETETAEQVEGDEPAVAQPERLVCIVNDHRCVGYAGGINGLVCSAHAVHYRADGTPRA